MSLSLQMPLYTILSSFFSVSQSSIFQDFSNQSFPLSSIIYKHLHRSLYCPSLHSPLPIYPFFLYFPRQSFPSLHSPLPPYTVISLPTHSPPSLHSPLPPYTVLSHPTQSSASLQSTLSPFTVLSPPYTVLSLPKQYSPSLHSDLLP